MNINSPAFSDNEPMPARFSRQGGNASPPLVFGDVPVGAKSLALVCHDPDAPRTEGWTHWVLWNIAPDMRGFDEASVSHGVVQGTTDWGETKWGGPQPPSGTHRYVFYLYALDMTPDLYPTATRSDLERAINGHVVDTATLTGLFSAT